MPLIQRRTTWSQERSWWSWANSTCTGRQASCVLFEIFYWSPHRPQLWAGGTTISIYLAQTSRVFLSMNKASDRDTGKACVVQISAVQTKFSFCLFWSDLIKYKYKCKVKFFEQRPKVSFCHSFLRVSQLIKSIQGPTNLCSEQNKAF